MSKKYVTRNQIEMAKPDSKWVSYQTYESLEAENKELKSKSEAQVLVNCELMGENQQLQKLKEIINSFDWEIRGNHVLTATCTRLTDEQIELLNQKP